MRNNASLRVKKSLEDLYDIPFEVDSEMTFGDYRFIVKPENPARELFEINVCFKNHIRLVIEIHPEKYAAFSISDMSKAPLEKKKVFAQYAEQIKARKARIEFFINNIPCEPSEPEAWPADWNSYKMRISRSPIIPENIEADEVEIAVTWTSIAAGMFLSLLDVKLQDEVEYGEGGVKRIEANRYERNPVNRELCLEANGYTCKICGFDFEKVYGGLGFHFIHVHHIVPVSSYDEKYLINPVKDMIPVCPNCHAMLHKTDPPLLPDELREILQQYKHDQK